MSHCRHPNSHLDLHIAQHELLALIAFHKHHVPIDVIFPLILIYTHTHTHNYKDTMHSPDLAFTACTRCTVSISWVLYRFWYTIIYYKPLFTFSLSRHYRDLLQCYKGVTCAVNADQPITDVFSQGNFYELLPPKLLHNFTVFTFLHTSLRSAAPITPHVVLLGPTGAGKSVQAAILAEKYQIVDGTVTFSLCVCMLSVCVCVRPYVYAVCTLCVCACSYPRTFLLHTQWTSIN